MALKLGLNLGYWGIGPQGEDAVEAVRARERAGLRLGVGGGVVRLRRGQRARVAGREDREDPARRRRSCRCRPAPRRRPRWRAARSMRCPAAGSSSASAPRARRCRRAGTASHTRSRGAAPASTSRSSGRSSPARASWSTTATTSSCRCPDGEGKALKLNFHPVRNRIPIFVGAIGRKSVEMAAETCDGWIPIFCSPDAFQATWGEHIEAGLAKGGRERSELEVSPTVQVAIDGDLEAARAVVRAGLLLYLGGMGSREDQLLRRPHAPVRVRRRGRRGPGSLPRWQARGGV